MRTILLVAALLVVGCKRHAAQPMAELASKCTAGDLGCPVPILYVNDLATSQRYFRDQLGFKLDWTDSDDFASVTRGNTQLFLCQRCQGHAGGWVWVISPDVDKVFADLKQRGARIKAEPKNEPWGLREMQVADIDGNVLRIGSPIDHD